MPRRKKERDRNKQREREKETDMETHRHTHTVSEKKIGKELNEKRKDRICNIERSFVSHFSHSLFMSSNLLLSPPPSLSYSLRIIFTFNFVCKCGETLFASNGISEIRMKKVRAKTVWCKSKLKI